MFKPSRSIMFIDTHAHLDFPELKPHLDAVLAHARLANVDHIITIGIDAATNQHALEIARQNASVYASVGWHPHEADKADNTLEEHLRRFSQDPRVIALGEIGLDYYRSHSQQENQRRIFARIINLARELDQPIIVHCREAFPDTLKILQSEGQSQVRGVFHCFAGDEEQLKQVLDLDFFISYTGNITYKNSPLPPIVRATPLDRLLLETDSPFMSPHPHRGQRNEPAHIPLIAARIAEIKGLSVQDVARITSFNAYRLFGIGAAPQRSIVYPIRNSLYVALTSRCTNNCRFCPRAANPVVKGHYVGMKLAEEPDFAEVIAALGDPTSYEELVFCGFGEPTIRFDLVLEVARWAKSKGVRRIRLDTNGQGNLIQRRDIVSEMVGLIDAVSVSLNEHRSDLYQSLAQSDFGEAAFRAVLDFARACVALLPEVTLTVVSYPGVNVEAVRSLAAGLGARFRVREYNEVG